VPRSCGDCSMDGSNKVGEARRRKLARAVGLPWEVDVKWNPASEPLLPPLPRESLVLPRPRALSPGRVVLMVGNNEGTLERAMRARDLTVLKADKMPGLSDVRPDVADLLCFIGLGRRRREGR
jgi:hypothetical protein